MTLYDVAEKFPTKQKQNFGEGDVQELDEENAVRDKAIAALQQENAALRERH